MFVVDLVGYSKKFLRSFNLYSMKKLVAFQDSKLRLNLGRELNPHLQGNVTKIANVSCVYFNTKRISSNIGQLWILEEFSLVFQMRHIFNSTDT